MSLSIVKDSIDLGIITKNADKMLAFYRDTLGLEVEGELRLPGKARKSRNIRHIPSFRNAVRWDASALKM